MNDKSDLELERKTEGQSLSYNPPNMSSEWEFNGSNLGNSSLGLVSNVNGMVVGGDGVGVGPSCSSNTMVDSFASATWEHPVDSVALGFNEMNVHKGSMFIPNMSDIMPDSLSHFPADSACTEHAARFSSFGVEHFEELLNPFGIHQSVNPYLHAGTMMQGPREILLGNAMKMLRSRQPQNRDENVAQTSKDSSLPLDQRAVEEGSPLTETVVKRFHEVSKQGVSVSGNDSDELQYRGGCTLEESTPLSAKGLSTKKRIRNCQDTEQDNGIQLQSGETGKEISETRQKGKQISAPTLSKSNGKQSSQNSDPPNGEYIHVRARRGQATNSHSLAERVRREKISERMKFLQDLVPGCSKVTGKAVMLDEIINYVQSLQRQVEFLSMKLATVNPRVEFSIDQLLAKDHMLSLRSGPSGMGISPSIPMGYPSLHPSQPAISHAGHPGITKSSDLLRRTINSQLTNMGLYKKPTHQLPKAWDDELHNVVQMGFNVNDPLEHQETNRPAAQGPLKHEP